MSGVPLTQQLYVRLADGLCHSGQQLAASLGVTRTAVWKAVGQLREAGLQIEASTTTGYQLRPASVPLDGEAILEALPESMRVVVRNGQVLWSVPSTNTALLEVQDLPAGRCDFLLAECQTAGRGRRARTWLAPPGGALCLSLSWGFASLPADIAALSLAIGIATAKVLNKSGPGAVQLKWPNDLQVADRKLGGILIELRAEAAGPAYAVIGIGLNVQLGSLSSEVRAMGTEPADLASCGLERCDRNILAAALIAELIGTLQEFERHGFGPFLQAWREVDALQGREVTVSQAGGQVSGTADGVEADGALRLRTASGLQSFHSGEVSVRIRQ